MTTAQLGFAIPTYKRPDQLARCVRSMIRAGAPHGVPIHVADDACDDTNVATIEALRAEYPLVFHHRNPTNLGIDRNILHSVEVCDAQHVWIMGEDDRVTPDAVERVIRVLGEERWPFVFVNYQMVDEDVSLVLRERVLPLAADRDVTAEEFLASDAWAIGFIGACVVDKALWSAVDPAPYVGTYYAHVGTIFEYLRGRRVRLVSDPVVLNRCGRPGVATWKSSTFDVLHGWGRMVDGLRPFYPADACDRATAAYRAAFGIGSLAFFAYLRADGALDARVWHAHVRNGPYRPLARAAAWSIAHAPPPLFQAARWGLGVVRSSRNRRISGY